MPGTAGIRRQNHIVECLTSPALEQQWAEWLRGWRDADPEQITIARLYVTYLRDQMLEAVSGLEDEHELEAAAALMYMQLRAQAALLNTQMACRMERGMPSPEIACRAALLSLLLGQVEEVLGHTRQQRLDEILNQPLLPRPDTNDSGRNDDNSSSDSDSRQRGSSGSRSEHDTTFAVATANRISGMYGMPGFGEPTHRNAAPDGTPEKKTPATVAAAARAAREIERSVVSAHTLRLRLTALLTEDETPLEPLSDDALIASVEGLISTLHLQDTLVYGYEQDRILMEREIGHASGREVASVMADMRLHLDTLVTENLSLRQRYQNATSNAAAAAVATATKTIAKKPSGTVVVRRKRDGTQPRR